MSLPTVLMPTYNSPNNVVRNARRLQPRAGLSNSDLSPTAPFDDNPKWKLFITTSSKVCAWDHEGCEPIFTSFSHGIVAAKRARDGSVLAIADAQVVMLHKVEDGQDKSYRLRGTQRCRLLQYSHDSRNLFYTDSLHNSVQSYSLSDNRVADAARSHPSPITAFAVSCDSNLIVSASAKPSTIQIYNQMMTTTITLVPSASSAPVVTCAFHPSRKHLFLLAFGDGVLAAFDYTKLSSSKNSNKENPGLGIARCHSRGIHAFRHLHDPSVAGSAGITGAGFVPGQRSRAVTVGEDGRCFLVDFEKGDTLGSWHIGAPATGLTVREIDAGPGSRKDELGSYFIAIGTVHGRCLVYDGNGNKVAERVIDPEGESVLDVEWVCGDVNLPGADMIFSKSSASVPYSPGKATSAEQSEKSSRLHKPIVKSGNVMDSFKGPDEDPTISLPMPEGDDVFNSEPLKMPIRRRHRTFSPPVYDSLEDTADQGYMKLFSPVKRKRPSKPASLPEKKMENSYKPTDPRVRASVQESDHRSAISAPQMWADKATRGEGGNEGHNEAQETALGSFAIFQTDAPKETTTAEESQSSNPDSNNISVFEGLSNVPGEQIKMDEITEDGRILSEIRSVRAKFSGKSAGTPEDVVHVLNSPAKARSTPVSRIGHAITADSIIKRSASAPEQKSTENHYSSGEISSGKIDGLQTIVVAASGPEDIDVQSQPTDEQPKTLEEIPTEDDGDIWAAQATTARSRRRFGRKRKKSPNEDEEETTSSLPGILPESGGLSRVSSTTHSSKSRKTVSWSDDHDQQSSIGVLPTPLPSSSVMGEFGERASTLSRAFPGTVDSLSTPSRQIVILSRGTVSESGENEAHGGDSTSVQDIVTAALAEMQAAMTRQMTAMQSEMQRLFRQQHDELQGLRSEIASVKQENEKLRNALFQSTGVRDSVKRNMGAGATTH